MSIKIKDSLNKPSSALKSGRKGNVSAGGKTGKASSTSQAPKKDAVSVSNTDKLTTSMSGSAAQRAEKVAQIKLDVESGDYKVDSQKTADKLIDSLTDYSLA